MKPPLLVLRPEPGARHTCARAATLGLTAIAAPVFVVRPVAWGPPTDQADALMLTSANAARHAGAALSIFVDLPAYVVGTATASAARAAGLRNIRTAAGNGAALLALLEAERPGRVLHLVGEDHLALESASVVIERRVVYTADAVEALPPIAREALQRKAVVLLHSPRAACLFARLVSAAAIDRRIVAIAAISWPTLAAAGEGWSACAVASAPDDHALLAAAARLCDTWGVSAGSDDGIGL